MGQKTTVLFDDLRPSAPIVLPEIDGRVWRGCCGRLVRAQTDGKSKQIRHTQAFPCLATEGVDVFDEEVAIDALGGRVKIPTEISLRDREIPGHRVNQWSSCAFRNEVLRLSHGVGDMYEHRVVPMRSIFREVVDHRFLTKAPLRQFGLAMASRGR